jgi:hypothetical protein
VQLGDDDHAPRASVMLSTLCKPVAEYLPLPARRSGTLLGFACGDRVRSQESTTEPRAAAQLCGSNSDNCRIGHPPSSFSITSIR